MSEEKKGIYLTCHSCSKTTFVADGCGNCGAGAAQFVFGDAKNGGKGLFCGDCNNGWTTITCDHCGEANAAIQRLVQVPSHCFIATAAYGDYNHPQVKRLREFRDNYLMTNFLGRSFTKTYYRFSPRLADWLQSRPNPKKFVRFILDRL